MSQLYRNVKNEKLYHLNQVNGYRQIKLSIGEIVRTSDSFNPMRQSWEDGATDMISPYAVASSYWRFTKEQIFEEERVKTNIDLPSRLKSIWLTEPEQLDYWYKTLAVNSLAGTDVNGVRGLSVFLVEATGKIFKADAHWYEALQNPTRLIKVRSYARHYWNGDRFRGGNMEVLLEGEMRLIEELKI